MPNHRVQPTAYNFRSAAASGRAYCRLKAGM